MTRLTIHGWGAVSPVGLTSVATCAAVRAGIAGFHEDPVGLPPAGPLVVAPVPATWRVRPTAAEWLVNLASRAIAECVRDERPEPLGTVLLLALPEEFRKHPGGEAGSGDSIIRHVEWKLGARFHPQSGVLRGGAADVLRGLELASTLLEDSAIRYCIVGGVDSLVNERDIGRLTATSRLKADATPQGLIPGEGASFVLVSATVQRTRFRALGQVLGVGTARETQSALGPTYSIGDGLLQALSLAAAAASCSEARIDFVISTFNGERYGAWESMVARPRFYRSHRERLEIIYPAMSVGEIGTAAPALAIIIAATAIARGYAPGPIAMCEAASDEGLRGACVIGPSPDPPAFETPTRRAVAR